MKTTKVQNLVYKMITENTGSHMLDSGGAYGRMWQRNQNKSIQDFIKAPECTLEITNCKYSDIERIELNVTISVFHHMVNRLELDALCDRFNRRKVANWYSKEFYGVSDKGESFLLEHFEAGESFNTYNWSGNYSQVLQGCELEHKETGDKYMLIQIHGGCDVRGGYTDAKLFKLSCEYFLSEDCMFQDIDYMGEFITNEGRCVQDSDLELLKQKYKLNKGDSVTIEGSLSEAV